MSITVPEIDDARKLTFEEVAHAPGSVFVTVTETPHPRSRKPARELGCYELSKADLVIALRDMFGLVDPLELAFQAD